MATSIVGVAPGGLSGSSEARSGSPQLERPPHVNRIRHPRQRHRIRRAAPERPIPRSSTINRSTPSSAAWRRPLPAGATRNPRRSARSIRNSTGRTGSDRAASGPACCRERVCPVRRLSSNQPGSKGASFRNGVNSQTLPTCPPSPSSRWIMSMFRRRNRMSRVGGTCAVEPRLSQLRMDQFFQLHFRIPTSRGVFQFTPPLVAALNPSAAQIGPGRTHVVVFKLRAATWANRIVVGRIVEPIKPADWTRIHLWSYFLHAPT